MVSLPNSGAGGHALMPAGHWLPQYQAGWLTADLVAGLTRAAYAVPVSTACASLAGVPPLAGIYVLAWLLRLSALVSFISETMLVDFKAGAALTIAMTQLPKRFGVPGGRESHESTVVGQPEIDR